MIVTRYFGGIKLGVGPLFRAYYDSALGCLAEALPKKIFITRSYKVVSDYNNITLLKRIFEKYAINYNANYSEVVEFYPNVLISQVNEFENELINKFNGKVHFEIIEKIDGNN